MFGGWKFLRLDVCRDAQLHLQLQLITANDGDGATT